MQFLLLCLSLVRVICTLILSPCPRSCFSSCTGQFFLMLGTLAPHQTCQFHLIQVSMGESFPSCHLTLYYLHAAVTVCEILVYVFNHMLLSVSFQLELSSSRPGHQSCLPLLPVLKTAPVPSQTKDYTLLDNKNSLLSEMLWL